MLGCGGLVEAAADAYGGRPGREALTTPSSPLSAPLSSSDLKGDAAAWAAFFKGGFAVGRSEGFDLRCRVPVGDA